MTRKTYTVCHRVGFEGLPRLMYFRADLQGRIFRRGSLDEYDTEKFLRTYVYSWFCAKQFDCNWSAYHNTPDSACYETFLQDYKKDLTKTGHAETYDFAYWLGFTYFQLHIETGLASSTLFETIPYRYLYLGYDGFISRNFNAATDEMCAAYNLTKLPPLTVHEYPEGVEPVYNEEEEAAFLC